MDLKEARELLNDKRLWPKVRDYLTSGGELIDFSQRQNRLVLLDKETLGRIHLWLDALSHAEEWKRIVNGEKVRELKANYPGVYPEVLRYLPYFSKFDLNDQSNFELIAFLLKLKFPEAYELCCS